MSQSPQVFTIINTNGLVVRISNYGATLLSVTMPDKDNNLVNVVVGLENLEDYLEQNYIDNDVYLGSTVGRWAGRISGGKFTIDEVSYQLYKENGVHLHGGKEGFDKKIWNVDFVNESTVTLSYISKHLEEGYPGNLNIVVTYSLTIDNELKIAYKATTDKTTPVNLTNHAYFNLDGSGSILGQVLELNSDKYVELDEQLLVTGRLLNTENSPNNFKIKSVINHDTFDGMDDIFVLNTDDDSHKVSLASEKTGIEMKVYTNQPTLVVYTPHQLPKLPYKGGVNYSKYSAICFEAEGYPDAVNQPSFPSGLLKPSEIYNNTTVFKFSLK